MEPLEGKLTDSIKMEGLTALVQDGFEVGLDLALKEGVLRDIPIVGCLINTTKIIGSIRDRLFLNKIVHFLSMVGEITQEEREHFVEENCRDARQFEEALLMILEQTDNMNKPALIGKIFKACILGKIKKEDSFTLSELVNRTLWGDLIAMFEGRENRYQEQRLFISGLFEMNGNLKINELGKLKVSRNDYAFALHEIYHENYDNLSKCIFGKNGK